MGSTYLGKDRKKVLNRLKLDLAPFFYVEQSYFSAFVHQTQEKMVSSMKFSQTIQLSKGEVNGIFVIIVK